MAARHLPSLPASWSQVAASKNVAVTTFRRNGQAVTTPMWIAPAEGRILTTADFDAWKLKRIAHNPAVRLAPCTLRGTITGPAVDGVARVLDEAETEAAIGAKRRRYLSFRVMARFRKRQVGIEIRPNALEGGSE